MHYLSVGAMFKNEGQILREWIEHYLLHGVDHFYLIDDNSSDDFLFILEPYIDRGVVTLFQHTQPWDYYLGRQKDMYNHFILPKLHETQWLVMIDLDEYLWSPMSTNLKTPLQQCMHIGQIQVKNNLFGSNGHIQHNLNLSCKVSRNAPDLSMKVESNILLHRPKRKMRQNLVITYKLVITYIFYNYASSNLLNVLL